MLSALLKLRIQQRTEVKSRSKYHLGENVSITSTKKVGNQSTEIQKSFLTGKVAFH